MKCQALSFVPRRPLLLLIAILISAGSASAAPAAPADKFTTVLYRFHGNHDGENPAANLIEDQAGNLYGTTEYGGVSFYGTVFELSPPGAPGGAWTETTLYSFTNTGDGARPTAGLIFDHVGNLYGTTSDSAAGGFGEVFELSPPNIRGGAWTETVLYSFQGGTDGAYPSGGVIIDSAGNLYGATSNSVFQLSPPAYRGGAWTFTLLHEFACCTSDGWNSLAGLVMDQHGNLYGTTEWGGFFQSQYCQFEGCGTVFEISPPGAPGGAWTEQVLHAFTGDNDGYNPFSGVILDGAGNLYGTTYGGGTLIGGIAYQLSPPAQQGGAWTNTVLHNFSYTATDGAVPVASLILDQAGHLYGTAEVGGKTCFLNGTPFGCGVVYALAPPVTKGGPWTEAVLFFFARGRLDAKNPVASLIFTKHGNLVGTTVAGGYNICGSGEGGCGTVFMLTP
jgi:hypothetical protein